MRSIWSLNLKGTLTLVLDLVCDCHDRTDSAELFKSPGACGRFVVVFFAKGEDKRAPVHYLSDEMSFLLPTRWAAHITARTLSYPSKNLFLGISMNTIFDSPHIV